MSDATEIRLVIDLRVGPHKEILSILLRCIRQAECMLKRLQKS